MTFQTINPTNGEVLETFAETTSDEAVAIVLRGHAAFLEWRAQPIALRASRMNEAARLLRAGAASLARTMALEMGKPLAEGEGEVEKCAGVCEYYAAHAEELLAPQPRKTDASASYVRFDPLGIILAVMPWNFPLWQVFRFAAPALMAGNAAILKHAPNVSRSALHVEAIFRNAGMPEGLFRAVLGGAERVPALIADPRVCAVTLTGSERAGAAVAEQAGRAIKKSVLELGGSDPFIVLEDADVDRAAEMAATARLICGGQSCIAAKRFIVMEKIADRFTEGFARAMAARKMGDPLSPDTRIGPQARHDLRDALHRQVTESVRRGAKLVMGGEVPAGPGAFYPPTMLAAVDKGMPAFDEETFGPVAAVIRARTEDDALALANDTTFGLGASVWTADRARAERFAAEISAGCVFVNGYVRSDSRLPFGGVKKSGYGRELSEYGIREFVNVKSVWIA